jgi:hypothetical protein
MEGDRREKRGRTRWSWWRWRGAHHWATGSGTTPSAERPAGPWELEDEPGGGGGHQWGWGEGGGTRVAGHGGVWGRGCGGMGTGSRFAFCETKF